MMSGAIAITAAAFGWAWLGAIAGPAVWLREQGPALLLLAFVSCSFAGLHRSANRNPFERFRMRGRAVLTFIFSSALLLLRGDPFAAIVILPSAGVLFLVLGLWGETWVVHILDQHRLWRSRVAVYGADDAACACARDLKAHPEWGMDPVAFIVPDEPTAPSAFGDGQTPLPVWRARDCIARSFDALAVPAGRAPPHNEALPCIGTATVLLFAPTGDLATFGAQVRHFDGSVAVELGGARRQADKLKRATDLLLTVPLAILAAPVVAVLALAIKLVDPGPALYSHQRVGRHGRMISVLKLRTMYQDAESRLAAMLEADAVAKAEWKRRFKLSNDPRVLPRIGWFLRHSSLDELPQLWNVIKGDIALVGPRPFPPYHVEAFPPDFRTVRASVPPGLTGVWQISCRSEGDLEAQRLRDAFYIRNRSLWLDIYVILATLPAVLRARGAK
jgi:lipopolysaccharide/colanic/teichoic acid biosynthesis glycosyltransferase